MNQRNLKLTCAAASTLMAAAFYSTIAFAATPPGTNNAFQQARVETRIKDLHTKLKITPAEEEQWAKVTDVMRENAKRMDELNGARATNANTMTAVDDLKSYGEITDAHADEIKKFTAAFEPLYAGMSDAQKAEADAIFRHGARGQKLAQKK